jgi:hypothetical protein
MELGDNMHSSQPEEMSAALETNNSNDELTSNDNGRSQTAFWEQPSENRDCRPPHQENTHSDLEQENTGPWEEAVMKHTVNMFKGQLQPLSKANLTTTITQSTTRMLSLLQRLKIWEMVQMAGELFMLVSKI